MIIIPTHEPVLEAILQRLIIAHVNALPNAKVWRANTGMARVASGKRIRFGVKGQADVTGIIGPTGRRTEIEVKSLGEKQTPDQKKWQMMVEKFGGLYILAYSLSDAVVPICRALGLEYKIA